jgi:transcriptional regulator with XRE-family HTH domain
MSVDLRGPKPIPGSSGAAGGGGFSSERLRKARLSAGLSRPELARLSGVSYRTISLVERGRRVPRFSTLRCLAEALEVEVGYFFEE